VDVYAEACSLLEEADVRYLVIGVMGINLHSTRGAAIALTEDCDLLLPPEPEPHRRAAAALAGAGFLLEAGGEPLVGNDAVVLAGIVNARARVRATKDLSTVDLTLQAAGLDFDDLWPRHTRRRLDGTAVRVAPLQDIVRSKMLANRLKDRLFLATYADRLAELMREEGVEPPPDLLG
jgi:hypothetical protein